MTAYCEDCKKQVEVHIYTDWIGDADGMYGEWPIRVWQCRECGGQTLRESEPECNSDLSDVIAS